MCGEQKEYGIAAESLSGSPPRVRGTGCIDLIHGLPPRITPACAGNSTAPQGNGKLLADHPRVCGEQLPGVALYAIGLGSPPRVRGTARYRRINSSIRRITPACAGNSRSRSRPEASCPDHPRVCGEQTKKSPSFQHSLLSDQENSFSLKYNCSISSQSFCARWTSLQGSSKCFAKVDS